MTQDEESKYRMIVALLALRVAVAEGAGTFDADEALDRAACIVREEYSSAGLRPVSPT